MLEQNKENDMKKIIEDLKSIGVIFLVFLGVGFIVGLYCIMSLVLFIKRRFKKCQN
jgi:hypothetical protein